MRFKDVVRPIKNVIRGKQGLYKVIDIVGDLEKAAGETVTTVFDVGGGHRRGGTSIRESIPSGDHLLL